MRVVDIQVIGEELALKWEDGRETYLALEHLRRRCPCAACRGEVDVMGYLYRGPAVELRPESFRLIRVVPVGGYALQPYWADGHSTGIYSFEYLRALGEGAG